MTLQAAILVIQNLGFPVVVTGYLLWRIEPILRQIAETQAAQVELMRLFAIRYMGASPTKPLD